MTTYSLDESNEPANCDYCKKDFAAGDYFDVDDTSGAICHPCLMSLELKTQKEANA